MTQPAGRFTQALAVLFRESVDPARCLRVLSAQVVALPEGRKPAGLMLGSGVLLYRWVDLSSLPRNRRRSAVAAQLRAWSPFAESGYRVAWFDDSAGLFAWDAARLRQRLADAGQVTGKPLPAFPEPWLHAQPTQDTVRLLRMTEGVEAQVWQRGSLRACRWWPQLPEETDWLNFQRGAGLAPGAVLTLDRALQDAGPVRAEGWGALFAEADLQSRGTAWEALTAVTVSLGLMSWTAVLAHDQWQLNRQFRQARDRLAQLQEKTRPVIAARESALRDVKRVDELVGSLRGPDALAVIEHLLLRLPQVPGVLVRQFELSGRQVRLALEVPQWLERAAVVTAIESGGWLVDVREARDLGGGTLNLAMALNDDRPPLSVPPPPPIAMPEGVSPARAATPDAQSGEMQASAPDKTRSRSASRSADTGSSVTSTKPKREPSPTRRTRERSSSSSSSSSVASVQPKKERKPSARSKERSSATSKARRDEGQQ